jgi:uncharacterized cofD-like protein
VHNSNPKLAVIGGGTGSFNLLSALKTHTRNITALVNMADNGGSSGVLRDELGVLPPGDIRQCLVALSMASEELRGLFNFRFPEGTFSGHSFGNLFLSAVESMTDDFNDAVRMAGEVLRIRGEVLPMTLDKCNLVLQTGSQKVIGEYEIAYNTFSSDERPVLSLEPRAKITEAACQAIARAELVVIAPGDLYSALAGALLVDGVGQALKDTKAKVVFVCNLINKPNHTKGFTVHDYVSEIERFGGSEFIDYVLYNTDQPEKSLLSKYALDNEFPVTIDKEHLEEAHYKAIDGDFLSRAGGAKLNKNDSFIRRSLIRHNGEAVARSLMELLGSL